MSEFPQVLLPPVHEPASRGEHTDREPGSDLASLGTCREADGRRMSVVVIGDVGVVDRMMHIGDEAMFEVMATQLAARGRP
ncbi:hypothetical protein GCM10025866_28240 [Naasia aerilata]|uniref:Uncharacterized protein n=1 Tax=Naasia aerilata TaxID=1162966 RepID=A0ABM8GF08_9MICO|nr:hypothetical protein GCM10025866_28240 [Naasia aerilata]